MARMDSNNHKSGPIYDRDGRNVSVDEWRNLVSLSYTESRLMTVFMCGEVMLLLACGALIRAGGQGIRQYAIPWLGLVAINAVYGSALISLDCVFYGLHTPNIGAL